MKQCKKCPWKKTTNPHDIPNEYCKNKHRAFKKTIAEKNYYLPAQKITIMACHNFPIGEEKPCVGWVHNQLGTGNNIALRLAAKMGKIDTNYELDGEQHLTFEETLPL